MPAGAVVGRTVYVAGGLERPDSVVASHRFLALDLDRDGWEGAKYVCSPPPRDSVAYKAFHINYPSRQDRERARQAGVKPGGSIMIHGLPNDPRHAPDYYASQDWTDGCIALSNAQIERLWQLVPDGTTIEIRP